MSKDDQWLNEKKITKKTEGESSDQSIAMIIAIVDLGVENYSSASWRGNLCNVKEEMGWLS